MGDAGRVMGEAVRSDIGIGYAAGIDGSRREGDDPDWSGMDSGKGYSNFGEASKGVPRTEDGEWRDRSSRERWGLSDFVHAGTPAPLMSDDSYCDRTRESVRECLLIEGCCTH